MIENENKKKNEKISMTDLIIKNSRKLDQSSKNYFFNKTIDNKSKNLRRMRINRFEGRPNFNLNLLNVLSLKYN